MTATTTHPHPHPHPHPEPDPRRNRRIAVKNNKGGVGKTTVTIHLGLALARRGRRVLLVDFDPQANLTTNMNIQEPDITLADVLDRPTNGGAAAAIVNCGWTIPQSHLVDVLPADLGLEDRNAEATLPASHYRLHRVLYGVTDSYDYTLFDCRPALGHLEEMVVAALDGADDGLLIVVEPGRNAISGANRVMTQVSDWADRLDVAAPVLGVVINLYDARLNLHAGRAASMAVSLGNGRPAPPPILEPYVPKRTRIAEVNDRALPSTGDARLDAEGVIDVFDQLAEKVDG